ncbi:N-acetylglutamate synthase [Pseudovirgaria hyperparasitica]|uniref:Amino-acid acetyltransferase, mitochondrial n=1 Tax=Pseudovirgaria hyperparasitica TaxID=470096 RepID=A0A6A6WLX8_9PEZI|nr:N-acetylglutamate synthase [Pseudovirgaria hyperparasitica]KAF2763019.1 N-acetylglutamate synthase [Pseudovirgaria hyperparasitica]
MNILPVPPSRGLARASSKDYNRLTSACHRRSNHTSARFSTTAQFLDLPPRDLKAENAKTRKAEREFLLSLLKNAPTKRDAKAYLSHFDLPQKDGLTLKPNPAEPGKVDSWWLHKTGVNLGNLYTPTRAIGESPVFSYAPLLEQTVVATTDGPDTIHVALVKLRQPQILDDDILDGIGLTLSQLVRLGLNLVVVVDCDTERGSEHCGAISKEWEQKVHEHTDRVVEAIAAHNAHGVLKISDALGFSEYEPEVPTAIRVRGGVEVTNNKLLIPLLDAGIIPVLPPVASEVHLQNNRRVQADDIMLALTRELAGIKQPTEYDQAKADDSNVKRKNTSIDRIILLDPLGGIPSEERPDKAHVFINMEEEYEDIRSELQRSCTGDTSVTTTTNSNKASILGTSNPFSQFVEQEISPLHVSQSSGRDAIETEVLLSPRHIKNLDLFQRSLKLLPPGSSGLIITPSAAAISAHLPNIAPTPATGVRTRRSKNPLIHNLLTDKPMISSSLPLSRFHVHSTDPGTASDGLSNHPTFVKRGIPVTMIPDPRRDAWSVPGPKGTNLSLNDARIDFPRLLYLIEDSFGRTLDVRHYLARIQNRIAGIIIAGEYAGGAICTWETPPNYPNAPPVPYLDKFAVLRKAQGTGGVADIVFKALLRTCFPNGCVWRSRTNNPVNKWYRERSAGSWKLPGGQWTMFWTMEGMESMRAQGDPESVQRWLEWVDVCQNVAPSWADQKPPD